MAEPELDTDKLRELGVVIATPAELTLTADELANPRFTPRELRLIKDHTGRAFSQLVADEESDEKLTVMAWLKLRRDGFAGGLAELDDTVITLSVAPPDPTSGPPQTP